MFTEGPFIIYRFRVEHRLEHKIVKFIKTKKFTCCLHSSHKIINMDMDMNMEQHKNMNKEHKNMNKNIDRIRIWATNLTVTRLYLSSKRNEMLGTLLILYQAQLNLIVNQIANLI